MNGLIWMMCKGQRYTAEGMPVWFSLAAHDPHKGGHFIKTRLQSVMMSTGSMGVTVCQLFFRGFSKFNDLNRKCQRFSSHWRIEICRYSFISECNDNELCRAMRHLGHESHALFKRRAAHLFQLGKILTRNFKDGILVPGAVGAFRLKGKFPTFALACSHQFLLKSRDHLSVSDQERERISTLARVENLASIRQCSRVMHAGYNIFGHL